jgi:hypothetical protein
MLAWQPDAFPPAAPRSFSHLLVDQSASLRSTAQKASPCAAKERSMRTVLEVLSFGDRETADSTPVLGDSDAA